MSTDSGGNQHGRDGRFSDKPRKEPADTSLPNDGGTWPQGEALVGSLIDDGSLQQVDPDPEGAEMILDHAEGHLSSAILIAESDPQGSIAMSYDGARKSMVAILLTQGLRATGADTHRVTAEALEAQLGRTAVVIRPFHRMRQERREAEYYNKMIEYVAEDAKQTLKDARSIVESMRIFFKQVRDRPFTKDGR